MRRLRIVPVILCAFALSAGHVLGAEVVQYTGKTYRDPFFDTTENKPVEESAAMQQSINAMNVQGILYAMDNPVAIIDGKIYRVGSRLGAGQVIRIEKEGVTVSQSGKQFTIKQSRGKAK